MLFFDPLTYHLGYFVGLIGRAVPQKLQNVSQSIDRKPFCYNALQKIDNKFSAKEFTKMPLLGILQQLRLACLPKILDWVPTYPAYRTP